MSRGPSLAGRRIGLLAAQAFALGLVCALIVIPANALFLDEYGSGGLPWTYLAIAAVGALGSPMLARSLRRWPLPGVSVASLAGLAVVVMATWIGLEAGLGAWLAAVLLVLFPLTIQLGFVIVGGQAGRLLTILEMKEHFPRAVAGFPVGFIVGGLAAPLLLELTGAPERLLGATTVATLLFLALVVVTRRRFPTELATVAIDTGTASVPLRRLLTRRFVLVLFAYQLLSALGSQLLDFLVFDRAAARYEDGTELARFVSVYTVAMNVVDLLFLVVVAGAVLRRYGMRIGLAANPAIVAVIALAGLVTGGAAGVASLGLFLLVVSARTSDIALTDGATRTAIATAYQVLPRDEQLPVQAAIEGIGVPAAIGATGAVLLVLRDLLGVGSLGLLLITAVVAVAWTAVGVAVYRGYQATLRGNLRSRRLDVTSLQPDDAATLSVVERLLAGTDEGDVQAALDLVALRRDRVDLLHTVATTGTDPARRTALVRLADLDADRAAAAARTILDGGDGNAIGAPLRAVVVRVLATASDARDRPVLERARGADDTAVSMAALAGLARIGDDSAAAELVRRLATIDGSVPDDDVAAIFLAAASSGRPDLVAAVADQLADPARATVAAAGLATSRADVAPTLAVALAAGHDRPAIHRLVRAATSNHRGTADGSLVAVLADHVDHPSRDVGLTILRALAVLLPHDEPRGAAVAATVIDADVGHAARVLGALATLAPVAEAAPLRDALTDELLLLRARLLAALALRDEHAAIARAAQWLLHGNERDADAAVETLEVTLPARDRDRVIPVLRRTDDPAAALERMARTMVVSTPTPAELLRDLTDDPAGHWRRPWLAVCAAHVARPLPDGPR